MKKRNAMLIGILAMLAVITSIGLVARTVMFKKPIQRAPEGRVEYIMSDRELEELEKELEELETLEKRETIEGVEEVEITPESIVEEEEEEEEEEIEPIEE